MAWMPAMPIEPYDVGEIGEPAILESVPGSGESTPRVWTNRSQVGLLCYRPLTG